MSIEEFCALRPRRHGRRLIEDRHPRSCQALPDASLSKASRLRERTRLSPLPPGRKRALDHTPITESAVPHGNASRVPWVYHPPAPPAASRRFDLKSPTRRGTAHRGLAIEARSKESRHQARRACNRQSRSPFSVCQLVSPVRPALAATMHRPPAPQLPCLGSCSGFFPLREFLLVPHSFSCCFSFSAPRISIGSLFINILFI